MNRTLFLFGSTALLFSASYGMQDNVVHKNSNEMDLGFLFKSSSKRDEKESERTPFVTLTNSDTQDFFVWTYTRSKQSEEEHEKWIQNISKDNLPKDIHVLSAHNTHLTNLNSFKNLPSTLRTLSVEKNKFSDLSAVATFKNITQFFADRNCISDITALAQLSNLKEVSLCGNSDLSDISPLEKLEKLKVVRLVGCKIIDPTPLKSRILSFDELLITTNPLNVEKLNELISALETARSLSCCYDNSASNTIHIHLVTQKIWAYHTKVKEQERKIAKLKKAEATIQNQIENDKKSL